MICHWPYNVPIEIRQLVLICSLSKDLFPSVMQTRQNYVYLQVYNYFNTKIFNPGDENAESSIEKPFIS